MAPRSGTTSTYGLDQLLDQASAISLSKSPPSCVAPKRHPLPSPDIANWNPSNMSQDELLPPPKLPSVYRKPPSGLNQVDPLSRMVGKGLSPSRVGGRNKEQKLPPSSSPSKTSNLLKPGSPITGAQVANGNILKPILAKPSSMKHLDQDELSVSSKFLEDVHIDGRNGRSVIPHPNHGDLALRLLDASAFVALRKADSSVSSGRPLAYVHGEHGSTSTSSNSSGTISANEAAPLSLRKHRSGEKIGPEKCNDGPSFSKPRRMSYPIPPVSVVMDSPEKEADLQRSISLDGGFCRTFLDAEAEEHYARPRRSTEKLFAFQGADFPDSPNPTAESLLKRQSRSSSDLHKSQAVSASLTPPSVRRTRSDMSSPEEASKRMESDLLLKFQPGNGFESAVVPLPVVRGGMKSQSEGSAASLAPVEARAANWAAEREQSLMNSTVKGLGKYLEEEARRALLRMPMSKGDVELVLAQIASRVESRIEVDRRNFSASSGKAFKDCARTLLDVMKREVVSRNEKAARARCHQLMNHILLEAEMMLQEAMMTGKRNRLRVNVGATMKEITELALTRFRGSSGGFLAKEASHRFQSDLRHRLTLMAEHCAGG